MRKFLYIPFFLLLLYSCSSDQLLDKEDIITEQSSGSATLGVTAIIPPVEWANGEQLSRSSLVLNGGGMKFSWENEDKIGVYPVLGNEVVQQQCLTLIPGSNSQNAANGSFGVGGQSVLLSGSTQYAAYSPYNVLNDISGDEVADYYKQIPISYLGQKQMGTVNMSKYITSDTESMAIYNQSEAETSAHLGQYDFLAACATQADNKSTSFQFIHMGATVRFNIEVPARIIYEKIQVKTPTKAFTTKATIDLTTQTLTAKETSDIMTLEFSGGLDMQEGATDVGKYLHPTKNKYIIIAYMEVAPLTTGASTLYLIGQTSDGTKKYYAASLASKTIVAGKAYQWNAKETDETDISIQMKEITSDGYFTGEGLSDGGNFGDNDWE